MKFQNYTEFHVLLTLIVNLDFLNCLQYGNASTLFVWAIVIGLCVMAIFLGYKLGILINLDQRQH